MASLNTPISVISYNDDVTVSAAGGIGLRATLSSSGRVTVSAPVSADLIASGGVATVAAGSTQIQLTATTNSITASATAMNFTTTDFTVFRQLSVPWFSTQSTQSLTCAPVITPLAVSASTSILMSNDLIQQAGTTWMSTDTNGGLLRVSGLDLCGYQIKTTGPTLQLQDNTATDLLDIRATIINADPAYGVTIIDVALGANFQDTPIHNELGTNGPLVCDDTEGFSMTTNNTLFANLMAPVSGPTVTIQGNLYVSGSVSAAGACCTSDERVKRNVRAVDPESDLHTVLSLPRRVSFEYTPEYLAVEPHATKGAYSGFIAQELERVVPRAVYETTQTLSPSVTLEDFRHVSMDALVPYLVGAIKQLSAEIQELKQKIGQ
jgi:hypothetical protein